MKTGDIILVPFPFAELTHRKVRPCVVICETKDKFKDVVVSAISSVVPAELNENEILLPPDTINNLRASSVIKVDRIVTVKSDDIITALGKLNLTQLKIFVEKFRNLAR
ncbi:MAG: type II toxin-antitoxin system PemK/MazF family toxin [Bacteroidota bacterium]|nr:type II toxin-antitoxin system PemK/MazF family toxin [Bacteroidota bacterium]